MNRATMKEGDTAGPGEPQDNFNRELYAGHAVAGEGGPNEKMAGVRIVGSLKIAIE